MADAATAAAPANGGQGAATTASANSGQGGSTQASNTNTATTAAATAPFYDGFTDAGLKEWAGKKGWSNVESLAKSAHSLEQMIGAPADEVIRLPKNATPDQTRSVLQRLGLPESPDKYEIYTDPNQPVNENFAKWAKETFHKAGMPAGMAKDITKAYSEFLGGALAQQSKDYELGVAADEKALHEEWKNGYDAQMNRASTAARQLGFTPEMVDAIEAAVGFGGTMRFFAGLASKMGESTFVSGDSNRGGQAFGMQVTPAEAKAEWDKLSTDKGFADALMNRTHPGHKAAVEKKSKLMSLMG